jgi:uncharacterized protein YodC (DUF2158 family)
MSIFTNRISIVAALTFGIAFSALWSVPAFPHSAPSAMAARASASFQPGERVRMRSGGPMMTVDVVRGNQIDCYWTDVDGAPVSESFPAAVLQKF